MAKILIAEPLADAGVELLRSAHEVDARPAMTREELLAAVAGVDALVVRSATRVDAEVLEAGRDLKGVGRAGIGLDNVAVAAATRLGIMVVHAPQSNVISAAEHTVALILAQARNIPQAHAALRNGGWERQRFRGTELYGKTLGIVGLGRIGRSVAKKAKGLDMHVIAYDPFLPAEVAESVGVELVDMDTILEQSDVISIHMNLTDDNYHMFNKELFAKCKKQPIIINEGRGAMICEEDLAWALDNGLVRAAGLDMLESEFPELDKCPLLGRDNVIITPHSGFFSDTSMDLLCRLSTINALLCYEGRYKEAHIVRNGIGLD